MRVSIKSKSKRRSSTSRSPKRKTFKRKSSSRSMVKRRGSKKKSYKKSSGSGLFSGKVFGYTIPGVSPVLKNKTAQKIIVGAGVVSLALSVAQLINQPMVNRQLAKPAVRAGIAFVGGDIPGAVYQYYKDGGLQSVSLGGGRSQGLSSVPNGGMA